MIFFHEYGRRVGMVPGLSFNEIVCTFVKPRGQTNCHQKTQSTETQTETDTFE